MPAGEQEPHDRGRSIERKIGEHLERPSRQSVSQHVAVPDVDVRIAGKTPTKLGNQSRIRLDRVDTPTTSSKFRCDDPSTGTNFIDMVHGGQRRSRDHLPYKPTAVQEVLRML
ncbi:MAG: hypothetical protein AAGD32_08405 [Planctomycetota bacterium]